MTRNRSALTAVLCTAVLAACSSGKDNVGGAPPRISSFTATPPLIAPGESALLSWDAPGVAAAALSPGIGPVAGSTFTVWPNSTTLYRLTVWNDHGDDTAQVMVIVQAPPCTPGLSCQPTNPCHRGATTCGSEGGACSDTGLEVADGTGCGTGLVCRAGACVVPTCVPSQSCEPSTCVLGTTSCTTPFSDPVCNLATNAPDGTTCGERRVCSGGSCVAQACVAGDPCQPADLCRFGVVACTAPTAPGTCTPGATKPDGTSCSAGLACLAGACVGAPTIRSFTASPANIGPAGSSTLAWDVVGATTLSIDQGIGPVTGMSRSVAPTATTTYTLTASNAVGSAQRSVTVTYSTIVSVTMPDPFSMEAGRSTVLTPRVVVTGSPSIEMDWRLEPGASGILNPVRGVSTLYTAPSQPGTYRVYATSVWDPTKWDNSVITVTPAAPPNSWRQRASLSTPRSGHTATLLDSGKVLVAGGASTASAEVFDPMTGSWEPTFPMTKPRRWHAAALLPSGKVLVIGGTEDASGEIYDPATNSWAVVQPSLAVHSIPSATVLPSGLVLVLGSEGELGVDGPGVAETFDPSSGDWSATDPIPLDRLGHSATALNNGRVLVAGGVPHEDHDTASTFIFDPALSADRWTSTAPLLARRSYHVTTKLRSGNVLVTGGLHIAYGASSLDVAEIFEIQRGTWVAAGTMSRRRSSHTATLLPNGRVLLVGGLDRQPDILLFETLTSAEIYEPATDSWWAVAPMRSPRSRHTATLLPTGTVLVVGGDAEGTVEEYTP